MCHNEVASKSTNERVYNLSAFNKNSNNATKYNKTLNKLKCIFLYELL